MVTGKLDDNRPLQEGRPDLHLLMKGPDAMPDVDYVGFQALTRLGDATVRTLGQRQGRSWTPPIGRDDHKPSVKGPQPSGVSQIRVDRSAPEE
jgi:hypothetical protein